MKRDPHCKLCSLHKHAETVCLIGEGPVPCDVMIIGEAPGKEEDVAGRPFIGRSGDVLRDLLIDVGLDPKDCFITNAVLCRPPSNDTPKAREINACKAWLDYQIKKVKPKFMLLLGNIPLQSVLGIKGIKKHRGRPIDHNGITVLPTFHPAYTLRDVRQLPRLKADVQRFKDAVTFGGIPEERDLDITIVNDGKTFDTMLNALMGVVSIDIETTCLYPWAPEAEIVSLGFGTSEGEFIVPVNHSGSSWLPEDIVELIEELDAVLQKATKVFHNGKFDSLWLKVHYGVDWNVDFDTMMAHYITDENSLHDLEHLAKLFFGAPDWDIPLSEKQGGTSIEKLAKYHAHDLHYTRKLYFALEKELKKDSDVQRVFDLIVMPCVNLFRDIEFNGCYVNTKQMGEAEQFLKAQVRGAEKRLKKWGDINWGSPKQVAKLLYEDLGIPIVEKTPKGAPSTNESCLKRIDHPAVADLLTCRGAKQQLSFFIEGWKPYIVNSRIHPSFKLHGTVTGRLSCEHPNFQQVPRDTRIRSLISAPKGWVFLEGDLSQIELRIVAELSRIPSMMKAFRDGVDIHWLTALSELSRGGAERDRIVRTAKALTGSTLKYGPAIDAMLEAGPDACCDIDNDWKELRKKAKAVNFGYVFGMWWKKFKIYARDNYGVHLDDNQARESREAFFDTYPLQDWHRKQQRYAREFGFVRSLSGRKRRLPRAMDQFDTPERAEAWRQAINSPVQSFANELNLMVLLQMSNEFPPSVFRPVMTVHDAIGAEVRLDHACEVVERMEEVMRKPELLLAFDIDLHVPIEGEVKLGPWGSGVSLNKWKG